MDREREVKKSRDEEKVEEGTVSLKRECQSQGNWLLNQSTNCSSGRLAG